MKRISSALLNALLPRTTQSVLAATLLRPEREWYLSDLAKHLGVAPSSLQRLLPRLEKAGILLRRSDGNRVYYRADKSCPIYAELSSILAKTIGLAEPLRKALQPLQTKINAAFVHGSMMDGSEKSDSDIDLIVIGNVAGIELTRAFHPLARQLGREVNSTRYSPVEFRQKVRSNHHFLSSVLKKPRMFIIGDERALEETIGRFPHQGGSDQQKRTG